MVTSSTEFTCGMRLDILSTCRGSNIHIYCINNFTLVLHVESMVMTKFNNLALVQRFTAENMLMTNIPFAIKAYGCTVTVIAFPYHFYNFRL